MFGVRCFGVVLCFRCEVLVLCVSVSVSALCVMCLLGLMRYVLVRSVLVLVLGVRC